MNQETEFELVQDGIPVASAIGSREDAWREIQHYKAVYGQDGPVEIYEVTRRRIEEPPNSTTPVVESSIPEGWQLVPKEPTLEMTTEGGKTLCEKPNLIGHFNPNWPKWESAQLLQLELSAASLLAYRAMLAASPKPEDTK